MVADYNELHAMKGYKIIKELMVALGKEDEIPSFAEFLIAYEAELEENRTKH